MKLVTDEIPLFERVRQHFSVKNPSAGYSEFADEFVNAISPTGAFEPGLVHDIILQYKKLEPNVSITYEPKVKYMMYPLEFNLEPDYCLMENFEDRAFQKKALDLALKYGRCVFELPTAVGKSFVIHSVIKNVLRLENYNTFLILVPNLQLVKQMHGDFLDYGFPADDIQMFSSFTGPIQKNKSVIIANRQWLENHSGDLPKIDGIIVDEVHSIKKKNNVTKYVKKLDTHLRIGFTGTMPENKIDAWTVKGIVGPLIYSERAHTFQGDKNILAPVDIYAFKFKHNELQPWAHDPQKKYHAEWEYIESVKSSNEHICEIAIGVSKEKNTLVLFDHTKHGKELFNILNRLNSIQHDHKYKTFFVNGETELDHREDVRSTMETSNNVILVANVACFGTGINVKNIYNIVFAMSGKGQTKIIQAIGRVLRKLENKRAKLIDIYHDFQYSTNHFLKRLALYRKHYRKSVDKSYEVKV